mgnify:CR=1 FL=1
MNLNRRQLIKQSIQLTGLGVSSSIIPMPLFGQNVYYGPKEGLARLEGSITGNTENIQVMCQTVQSFQSYLIFAGKSHLEPVHFV